jgi:hypothetical protein
MPENTAQPILRLFECADQPSHVQVVAQPFEILAQRLVQELPAGVDLDIALMSLLKSRASAVKAVTEKAKPEKK